MASRPGAAASPRRRRVRGRCPPRSAWRATGGVIGSPCADPNAPRGYGIRPNRAPPPTAATALAAGLLTAATGTASAADRAAPAANGRQGDFNGDGYRVLAVAAPAATVDGKKSAGAVTVLYHRLPLPLPARSRHLHRGRPAVGQHHGG
ncbi:FG-GAP repeat protein [Streptomyces sp. Isolate_219]|uniref:FG-GAP repeat protein n=1 Tax=Streptomyces sp. Isolate_219 TaxID=2950110 RepID=UPI0029059429|nr:FG-GAP repeat protein [Streptomyces sp. Isolate_219]